MVGYFRHSFAFIFILLLAVPALASHDHSGYFPNGFVDARSCMLCHKNMADELMDSIHYKWRTANPKVEFPGGGEHGMLDRACGLVGSNAIINFNESCGQCHIGNGLPFPDPSTGEYTIQQKWGIDCLICHASEGQYDMNNDGVAEIGEQAGERVRAIDPITGREAWYQDRSQRAAESVGGRVDNDACLRCHHHGQADYQYKRGTPFEPEEDVHAAAGLFCTDCHKTEHHKIARGSRVTDMFGWERQDVEVKCENCHQPSQLHMAQPKLNDHLDVIGCETCHIPEVKGAARRIWAPTYGATGPEANVPVYNDDTGKWEPYTEYDETLHAPVYRWYNGGSSMLAEPIDQPGSFSMQPANRYTSEAKILPFRRFISGQPMDALGLPGTEQFNPMFTMKSALDQMAPGLIQLGMMRPEGLTEAESYAMSQFPNMLYFDRADYFANGNVAEAVSIGMARLGGAMQGMDTSGMSREILIQMGSGMWSGQIAGLDLPNNPYDPDYVADQDPTTVTGSFITVSHAIKRVGALTCTDCHIPDGRLDFTALGYTDVEVSVLTSPVWKAGKDHSSVITEYEGPQQCAVCHQGKIEEVEASTHYKFESAVPEGHLFNEEGQPVTHSLTGKLWKLCGFPTALAQHNWLGALADDPQTDYVDKTGGCGMCHVGIGIKPFTATGNQEPQANEAQNVDCLICHADNYQRKMYLSTQDGQPDGSVFLVPHADGKFDFSVLTEAAQSVGPTKSDYCKRCHAAAGGGSFQLDDLHMTNFKRGDLFIEGYDVHADAGLECSDCHYAGQHKMQRPLNNDLSAHDVVFDGQMCTKCHTKEPHANQVYNQHLEKIACTTCHAHSAGGAVFKDFSVARAPDPNDPLGLWKPGMSVVNEEYPLTFAWFNGQAEPEIEPMGNRDDGLIHPYKEASFNQPQDVNGHTIPIKWGIFFKTGDMTKAIATGRSLYAGMWTEAMGELTGLPSIPGEFDHFTKHTVKFSISHGITSSGALRCANCHNTESALDFQALGYDSEEIQHLTSLLSGNSSADPVWVVYP